MKPAQAGFACVAKPLRWGDTALWGFPPLKQVSAGFPTCSKWRATSSRLVQDMSLPLADYATSNK
ncbi:hypothetical protein [Nostoc sp. TCL26-01]|uniref:hypothetical protein n=1 Tax=Nostoc sp. TCL26-01 TaxID=2576904 RepID=UPI001C4B1877|nr:hypothetical protein [Nostoc sp. TCL26-01]